MVSFLTCHCRGLQVTNWAVAEWTIHQNLGVWWKISIYWKVSKKSMSDERSEHYIISAERPDVIHRLSVFIILQSHILVLFVIQTLLYHSSLNIYCSRIFSSDVCGAFMLILASSSSLPFVCPWFEDSVWKQVKVRLGGMGGNYSLKTWNRSRSELIFSEGLGLENCIYVTSRFGWLSLKDKCWVLGNVFKTAEYLEGLNSSIAKCSS